MTEPDLAFATITEIAPRLRDGRLTSEALTALMLERIEALNPKLNAYITVTGDHALAQAHQADRELAAGRDLGPLHGIPIAVKDLFATKGIRTTGGAKLHADWIPEEDATAVRLLYEAGAVLLGKTGLHELAYGSTSINPVFGAIANPWALDHHPGGSSGGSAAAVAAGLAFAALGSDTGCSIRQPAHCCGIVGHKPSFGLVSKAGALPLVWTMDHVGPLTRSVGDAALLLEALAAYDPADPYSIKAPRSLAIAPDTAGLAGRRLGLVRDFFFEDGDEEVKAITLAAIETCRGQGAEIVKLEIPGLHEAFAAAAATFAEAGAVHKDDLARYPEGYSTDLQDKLEANIASPVADYIEAQITRRRFIRTMDEVMSRCDVLVAPTSTVAACPIANLPPRYGYHAWHNTGLFDFTGQPSISLPCGFTEAGLPVGLMITGRLYDDARVLAIAQAFEAATNWHKMRPPI